VKLTELSESNIKFPGKCISNKLHMVFSKKRAFFNFFYLVFSHWNYFRIRFN